MLLLKYDFPFVDIYHYSILTHRIHARQIHIAEQRLTHQGKNALPEILQYPGQLPDNFPLLASCINPISSRVMEPPHATDAP